MGQTVDPRDCGAIGDGVSVDTWALQAAIDTCATAGGGHVVVSPGRYLIGPVKLCSNLTLELVAGATLVASADIRHYVYDEGTSMESPRVGVIRARDVQNVSIVGSGVIDCSGNAFMNFGVPKGGSDYLAESTRQGSSFSLSPNGVGDGPVVNSDRPGCAVQFLRSSAVRLHGIRVIDSPNWTIHFGSCRDVTVSDVTIRNNELVPNSDGIHCTSCQDVRISGCVIEAGDDAIAVTGLMGPSQPTENVLVGGCLLRSRSAGVRVGYGEDDVTNCVFHDLIIHSNRGIGVFVRSTGSVRNILFSNMIIHTRLHTGHWWGHGEPIHLSAVEWGAGADVGVIEDVHFRNILAQAESGILAIGCQRSRLRNVTFDDVRLTIARSLLADSHGGNFDLRPTNDPAFGLRAHEDNGMYAEGVDGLKVRRCELRWRPDVPDYFAHAMHCVDCSDIEVSGFRGGRPPAGSLADAVLFERCRRVLVASSFASADG